MSAGGIVDRIGEAESASGRRTLLTDGLLKRGNLRHRAVGRPDHTADHGRRLRVDAKAGVPDRIDAAENLHLAEAVELAVKAQLHISGRKALRRQLHRVAGQLAETCHGDALLLRRSRLVLLFAEHDAGVCPAEGEGVGHHVFQRFFSAGIDHTVQRTGFFRKGRQILRPIARGGKDGVFRQRLDAQDSLNRARGAQAVAGHGLCGADGRR